MDYKSIACRFVKLFNEVRIRGPRKFGAKTSPKDRSGFVNPRDSRASLSGRDPGYGRDRVNPKPSNISIIPPISTPPPP